MWTGGVYEIDEHSPWFAVGVWRSFGATLVKMNSQAYANPSSTMSCREWKEYGDEKDIAPSFITLGTPSFVWNDPSHSFQIYAVKVSLRSQFLEDGKYECLLQGKDLQTLGLGSWLTLGPAANNKPVNSSGDCDLICGGIKVHATKAVTLYGKTEVFGVVKDASGKTEVLFFAVPLAVDTKKAP